MTGQKDRYEQSANVSPDCSELRLTAVSLFAGVGGFDLALQRAGINVAAAVEIDKAARSVLARQFPSTPLYEDVTRVHAYDKGCPGCLPDRRIDVVVGGFPCQDLSVAGRRAGLAGLRSGLFYELARIISELRPRWVILENVPGLLSSNDGRDMAAVVGTLGDLGYGWAYRVLDAQFFGVPQRRQRVFVVGHLGNRAAPVEVLLEPESSSGDRPTRREAGTRVAASLTAGTSATRGVSRPGRRQEDDVNIVTSAIQGGDQRGYRIDAEAAAGNQLITALTTRCGNAQDDQQSTQLIAYQCHGSNVGPMGTLRAGNGNEHGGVPFTTHALTSEGADASEDGTGRGTPLVAFAWQAGGNNDASGAFNDDGTTPCLPKSQTLAVHDTRQPAIPLAVRGRDGGAQLEAGRDGDPYNALRAGDGGSSRQSLIGTDTVRRLTPLECERLQGFPDGWTAGQADAARYRQMGNAVAVPVVEWITTRLAAVDARMAA